MQDGILIVPMPADYQYAHTKKQLRLSAITMMNNPQDFQTRDAFLWALSQDFLTAHRHSSISKTHWITVQDRSGKLLISMPGAMKLGH